MKIYSKLLALCVFQPNVWGTTAFFVQAPKAQPSSALHSFFGGNRETFDTSALVRVEGGSLRTCPLDPSVDSVQVTMKTGGRPLEVTAELWFAPTYTPMKIGLYIEDGNLCPFNAVIATPGVGNTIAIRNTGPQELPVDACVETNIRETGLSTMGTGERIQGGALRTYPLDASVSSVAVLLKNDKYCKLHATIELCQGPNQKKQVMEIYGSDGYKRPFFAVIKTPGAGNTLRIINRATVEFPFDATVEKS